MCVFLFFGFFISQNCYILYKKEKPALCLVEAQYGVGEGGTSADPCSEASLTLEVPATWMVWYRIELI